MAEVERLFLASLVPSLDNLSFQLVTILFDNDSELHTSWAKAELVLLVELSSIY
jgi:hypothetical protein